MLGAGNFLTKYTRSRKSTEKVSSHKRYIKFFYTGNRTVNSRLNTKNAVQRSPPHAMQYLCKKEDKPFMSNWQSSFLRELAT